MRVRVTRTTTARIVRPYFVDTTNLHLQPREYALGTHNYNTALHAATVLSILLYIILRYLKNNTRVLDEEGR
jgi:hypothetical protein